MTETPARRGMSGGKIALVIVGAIAALMGFAAMAGGSVLVWAHATQRDADGYYTTDTERFVTPTYALTSRIDLGDTPGQHDWTLAHPVGTVRVQASSTEGRTLFVGIGPQAAVESWLAGVAHEEVTGANFGPFHTDQSRLAGDRRASPPLAERFWVASVSGTGQQTLLWPSDQGRWTIVVMNADAGAGVAASVAVGAKTGILLPIGIGLLGFALLAFAGATTALYFGLRHQTQPHPDEVLTPAPAAPGTYPVRLNGHLDTPLSRWRWLVKWFLLIPHFFVLAFLWLALVMLTFVAGFAILFTGRYPRSIFDFNVGVMRWTWRVSFYGLNGYATDRYPPFTLRADPAYPADFTVDYPERLSRGLVLVKWWLLAIPHYLVVAVFAGGWSAAGRSDGWRLAGGGGLIALLVFIAGVVLLFRNRYPEPIFDFVMGMNRWCFRVLAYAALMRDEYPPFRFDSGGLDPGSVPSAPPPTPPEQFGVLVDVDTSV